MENATVTAAIGQRRRGEKHEVTTNPRRMTKVLGGTKSRNRGTRTSAIMGGNMYS